MVSKSDCTVMGVGPRATYLLRLLFLFLTPFPSGEVSLAARARAESPRRTKTPACRAVGSPVCIIDFRFDLFLFSLLAGFLMMPEIQPQELRVEGSRYRGTVGGSIFFVNLFPPT